MVFQQLPSCAKRIGRLLASLLPIVLLTAVPAVAGEAPQRSLFALGRGAESGTPVLMIDPDGATQLVSTLEQDLCGGLDSDHQGRLIAICSTGSPRETVLYAIDTATATVETLLTQPFFTPGRDASFDPRRGTLFVYRKVDFGIVDPPPPIELGVLDEFDLTLGLIRQLDSSEVDVQADAIAFSPHGTLYHFPSEERVHLLNTAVGPSRRWQSLSGGGDFISADWHPERNLLYATDGTRLFEVDPASWEVTEVATLDQPVTAIAWSGPAPAVRGLPQGALFFPRLVARELGHGVVIDSELDLLSTAQSFIEIGFEFFSTDGTPFDFLIQRDPLLGARVRTRQPFPAETDFEGWGQVTSDPPGTLRGEVRIELSRQLGNNGPAGASRTVLASVRLGAAEPAADHRLTIDVSGDKETALALLNPSPTEPAIVTLELIEPIGRPLRVSSRAVERTGILRPRQSLSLLVWDFVRTCRPEWEICDPFQARRSPAFSPLPPIPRPDDFQGSIVIRSGQPIAVSAIDVLANGQMSARPQ